MSNATVLLKEIRKPRGSGEMHMKSKDSTNVPSKAARSPMAQKDHLINITS